MKEMLQIPYIGIKVDAIPTILQILSTCSSDNDFITYYETRGKTEKTILEYLRSLKNLKLVYIDAQKNHVLTTAGINIISDSEEYFYQNLCMYLLKNFSDLRIIKDILRDHKNILTVDSLYNILIKKGFIIKRKKTLSSYMKMLKEEQSLPKIGKPRLTANESVSLRQLKNYLLRISNLYKKKSFPIKELRSHFDEDNIPFDDLLKKHLVTLDLSNFIHLSYFNSVLADSISDYEILNGNYCYKVDVLK